MPTVEDYFDDDTDIPLPSTSSRHLPNTGTGGALLEEISTDDPDVPELDYGLLAEQGRGIYGEGNKAPPASINKGKGKEVQRNDDTIRPSGPGASGPAANTPMGGFMGDMMRMQQVEDERVEIMRQQFGNTTMAKDVEYKG
jgi:signal recognition particle subunit SRP19